VRSFLAADTISTADQRKILLDNAAHFYGIQVPASVF
jgi:hypothetical protein